jgi:hypothetical protein
MDRYKILAFKAHQQKQISQVLFFSDFVGWNLKCQTGQNYCRLNLHITVLPPLAMSGQKYNDQSEPPHTTIAGDSCRRDEQQRGPNALSDLRNSRDMGCDVVSKVKVMMIEASRLIRELSTSPPAWRHRPMPVRQP